MHTLAHVHTHVYFPHKHAHTQTLSHTHTYLHTHTHAPALEHAAALVCPVLTIVSLPGAGAQGGVCGGDTGRRNVLAELS